MSQLPLRMEQISTAASDIETQDEAMNVPSVKVRRLGLAAGIVLLTGIAVSAATLIRHPLQSQASLSSIVSEDAAGGICFMTMYSACGCANCDAHVNTESGEEKCFSTVAVKDTDDDNGNCHDYATKCTLEVGKTYEVKCTGDWDSGAWLQIGDSKFCDGKTEQKKFVAKAAKITPVRQVYEKFVQDADVQHVLKKYGWTRALLDCIQRDAGSFGKAFDKAKLHASTWDALEPQLRAAISGAGTCANPGAADGMFSLKACMEKVIADDKAAHAGGDDDDDW